MDRPRRRPGLLILAAAGVLAGALAAGPPLRALRWLAPGADGSRILTRRPTECLAIPADPNSAYLVEVGRAAFRTPLILGGPAARAGLACETCHRGGRRNEDFDFPGLSGGPGTADVTSFLFSSHRGDHVDNPKSIPDLSGSKAVLKVSQSAGSPDLERFIHGLITEEFDGAEPPPTVLTGLAAYVRALSPGACPAHEEESVSAAADLADARRAVRTALVALARHDSATAVVMAGAARSMMGILAERYGAAPTSADVAVLRTADLDLAAAISDIRRADPAATAGLEAWLARSREWGPRILADESRSYYDRSVLAAAIAGR
ncbi:MAG TPA: hypothetical protein VG166_14075 [Caulobacteraceae bacterium]|nr:hypothetical protein [Caulobacteraceae bacterium]